MNNETPMPFSYVFKFFMAMAIRYGFALVAIALVAAVTYGSGLIDPNTVKASVMLYKLYQIGLFFAACKISDFGWEWQKWLATTEGAKYD